MENLETVEDTYMHRPCSQCGFVMTTPDRYCSACNHECPPPLLWHMTPAQRAKFRQEMQQARASDRAASGRDTIGLLLGLPFLVHVGVEMLVAAVIVIGLIVWAFSFLG